MIKARSVLQSAGLFVLLPLFITTRLVAAEPLQDPPLIYRLAVYDRDPGRLAPDGTSVLVYPLPGARSHAGLPPYVNAPCAETVVLNGQAELQVEMTPDCPAGFPMSFTLYLPGGPITADSEPNLEWRRAYSESTTVVDLVVRPIPPRTGGISVSQLPLVCPPNLLPASAAQAVTYGAISFDLPEGRFRWFESPVNSGQVVICSGTTSGVRLSMTTCAETGRFVRSDDEHPVFDAIVASCRRVT